MKILRQELINGDKRKLGDVIFEVRTKKIKSTIF